VQEIFRHLHGDCTDVTAPDDGPNLGRLGDSAALRGPERSPSSPDVPAGVSRPRNFRRLQHAVDASLMAISFRHGLGEFETPILFFPRLPLKDLRQTTLVPRESNPEGGT
jgi:hypothetical protein